MKKRCVLIYENLIEVALRAFAGEDLRLFVLPGSGPHGAHWYIGDDLAGEFLRMGAREVLV